MLSRAYKLVPWFVAVWIALPADVATGQPADIEARARALFHEGNQLMDKGKRERALDAYKRAYQLLPRPQILFNVGVVAFELGRKLEAARALQECVRNPHARPENIAVATELLSKLSASLGRVRLRVNGRGVVFANGDVVGRAPVERVVWVEAGQHHFAVRDSNALDESGPVRVDAGGLVDVNLRAVSASATAAGGMLTETRAVRSRSRSAAPWLLVAAGGATAIAGSLLGVHAQRQRSRVERQIESSVDHEFAEVERSARAANRHARIAGATIAAGAAVAAAGLLWRLLSWDDDAAGSPRLTAVAVAGGAAVGYAGRF